MLGSVRGVVSNDHSYRDKANPRVPTLFRVRKATRFGRTIARSERPGVVEEPGMCRSSLDGNREIPRLANCGGRRECEPAKHAPGAGPGKCVTGAGAHTASRKATEEGTVHLALPPYQR